MVCPSALAASEAEALARAFEAESIIDSDSEGEPDEAVALDELGNGTSGEGVEPECVKGVQGGDCPPGNASQEEPGFKPTSISEAEAERQAGTKVASQGKQSCATDLSDLFSSGNPELPDGENELAEYEPSDPGGELFPELFGPGIEASQQQEDSDPLPKVSAASAEDAKSSVWDPVDLPEDKEEMERLIEELNARYAAPHRSIPEGHVLITEAGNLEEEAPEGEPTGEVIDESGVPVRSANPPTPTWDPRDTHTLTEVPFTFDPRQHHAVRMQPNWLLVGYTPLGTQKLNPRDVALLESCDFPLAFSATQAPPSPHKDVRYQVRALSSTSEDTSESSISSEELRHQIAVATVPNDQQLPPGQLEPLEADLQPDASAALVGWDFSTGDPGDVPISGLVNVALADYLRVHGVSDAYGRLSALGVESPNDLQFLTRFWCAHNFRAGLFISCEDVEVGSLPSVDPTVAGLIRLRCDFRDAGSSVVTPLPLERPLASGRCFGLDVKSAFLLAPIPANVTRRYAMRPPRMLIELGLCAEDELWIIHRALYGFRESPKWWSIHRDEFLKSAVWTSPYGMVRLQQLVSEGNIWSMRLSDGSCVGHLLVYVDDMLLLTDSGVAESFIIWLRQSWECTGLKEATSSEPLRFLGVDIYAEVDSEGEVIGYSLAQEAYIDELLRSHQVKPSSRATAPVPREWVREAPACEDFSEEELRAGQRITGELLWLAQRTRLDIGYCVALMSSWVSRFPRQVSKIGARTLEYLANTKEHRLLLIPGKADGIRIYTDASFAPFGAHSISGILLQYDECTVAWKSKRQSLVTLSTAESELCAGCEGVTLAQSLEALISELDGSTGPKKLLVDNTAAVTIAEGGGSVRTRHLRVRAAFLHDMRERQELVVTHCPGDVQLADCLTKALLRLQQSL
ncbi:GIP [Symbiodinium sp. CCMP2592]|nr:GIP [Symbiodinium sp. CCMP2592]